MKKKILLATNAVLMAVLFAGCCTDRTKLKYKTGDIVYIKPDSTKAVIGNPEDCGCNTDYQVIIGYESGFFANNIQYIDEAMIYGK